MFKISIRHPYSISLLVAAVLILGVGIRFRPPQKNGAKPMSESDIARMQQFNQSRQLNELSRYLIEAAENVKPRLLYLKSTPHTAVIWDGGRAITSAAATSEAAIAPIGAQGADIRLHAATMPGGVPFAVLITPGQARQELQTQGAIPVLPNGEWVIAVARSSEDQVIFAHGVYQGAAPARCGGFEYQQVNSSAVLSNALAGGGVFTLQGQFLGIIFSCRGRLAVASVDSIATALHSPVSIADHLQQAYGLGLIDSRDLRDAAQVEVTMVWSGKPGKAAGVQPGDTILEVNGQPVHSMADLGALADDEGRSAQTLTILRGKKKQTVTMTAGEFDPTPHATSVSGLTLLLEPNTRQTRIQAVAADSPGARSGVQAGDVLARIGGVAVQSPEQAARLLALHSKGRVTLTVQRENAEAEVLLAHE